MACVAIVLFANIGSTYHDEARYQRLTHNGLGVIATITDCIGNLGGSGSNGAGFTCNATYDVAARQESAVLVGQSAFLAPHTHVSALVDPDNLGYVVARTQLDGLNPSATSLWPSATTLALVAGWLIWRRARNARTSPAS
jgi:hypothetical protein